MKSLEELTSSAETTSWIPADVYANLILDGIVCYGQLSGVVTAMEYDFTKGGGDTIQVRYISPRTHSCTSQTDSLGCQCLSETSSSFGTYSIKVEPWGDYDIICGYTIWETQGNIVEMILKEMAKRMSKCRDEQIYTELSGSGFTPNVTVTSNASCGDGAISGSCCTFTFDLYNSVISVQKHMQGDAYEPDYVIMHPDVAAFLYFKDGAGYHHSAMPQVQFDGKGQLTTIAGMKVIECCNANMCNKGAARVMAIVIDSNRAIGEVWGKKPTFEVERDPVCDRYKHVLWQYWGTNRLDPNAIGWITNP